MRRQTTSDILSASGNVLLMVGVVAAYAAPSAVFLYYGVEPPVPGWWATGIGFAVGFYAVIFNWRTWPAGEYGRWLAATPWRPGRPMPTGRPGPSAWVAAWFLLLCGLCLASGELPGGPVVGVSLGVLLVGSVTDLPGKTTTGDFDVRRPGLLYVAMLLALLAVWTFFRSGDVLPTAVASRRLPLAVVLLAAAAIAALARQAAAWADVRHGLRATAEICFYDRPADRAALAATAAVPWPAPVAPEPPPARWGWRGLAFTAIFGLLGTLAARGVQALPDPGPAPDWAVWSLTAFAVLAVVVVRSILLAGGRQSQTPWRLRLKSGRLLVPRRDAVWAGGLAGLAAGAAAAVVAACLGVPLPESVGLTWAAVVACLLAFGPSRRWVELCADGRIGPTEKFGPARTRQPAR